VFDRGYIDYKRFDEYCEHGIRFTNRLKDSAIVTVISENPVTSGGVVRRDCIVKLGDGKTKMQHELRLIEVFDTQGNLLSIITNDLKAPAEEIGQVYRYRNCILSLRELPWEDVKLITKQKFYSLKGRC
jgi:hypothetical protein